MIRCSGELCIFHHFGELCKSGFFGELWIFAFNLWEFDNGFDFDGDL